MDKNVLILSGGGARGAYEISHLKYFEAKCGRLHNHYDLMVGSSVGAINAAILSTGKITALELYEIYPTVLERIFKKKPWWKFPKSPMYDRQVVRDIWSEIIGSDFKFGDAKTKLMITSINKCVDDLGYEQTKLFKSWHNDEANLNMIDVICNSFAAPMFFGNLCVPNLKSVFTDGGAGNNNFPATETFFQMFVDGWLDTPNKVLIDGIGTLYSVNENDRDYEKVCKQNLLQQVAGYLAIKDGGEASKMSMGEEVRRLQFICKYNKNIKFRYWNTKIDEKYIGMDKIEYKDLYIELGNKSALNGPLKHFNC